MLTFPPLHRLGRIRQVDDREADENHTPERVLPGRAPHLPNDCLSESGRLSAGYRVGYEEHRY